MNSATQPSELPTNQPINTPAAPKEPRLCVRALLLVVVVIVGVVVGVSMITRPRPTTPSPSPSPTQSREPTTPSPEAIETFRQSLPAYITESLKDTNSAQYRAYKWVTESDQIPEVVAPDDEETRLFRMTQRFALATVFYSINKGNQVKSTISECEWDQQVKCTVNSSAASVAPEGFGGTLPREIGLLTSLTDIDLYWYKGLTSTIPTELGLLTRLSFLRLGAHDDLTSAIPTELGRLTRLTLLSIAGTSINSTIPTEFGLLRRLATLSLATNQLTSAIPTEIGRLSLLQNLYLSGNDLSGSIPTELGQLVALKVLELQNNRLTGTVPSEICSSLTPWVDCHEVTCTCCRCG
jgi:Leucine-rich repeat (LRR) protein